MQPRSLSRRIVAAFVLLTLLVSGLFSFLVVEAVDRAEDYFAEEALQQELEALLAGEAAGERPHVHRGTQLHVLTPGGHQDVPAWLLNMPTGYREVRQDGVEQHVLVRQVGERRYVLVQGLEEFERREQVLRIIVAVAFICSILAAWGIGVLMARRVIAPVTRLAGQVRHRAQLMPMAPPLAPDYGGDEVGQLAAAFDETLGALREALERERLFTSDVSHELRTPLMVIASSCDLLLAQGLGNPRQEEKIRQILDSCGQMQELVVVFLQLARNPQARDANVDKAGLLQVAREQHAHWQPEAGAKGLELSLQVEAEDTGLYPRALLRSVMANLLRNAIHYTDRGYVQMVLHRGGFSIRDSGVGIPPEHQGRIFQPFFRGDPSRGDGLGLGLSLVQRICRQQSWHIRFHSPPTGGCEFRVDFFAD